MPFGLSAAEMAGMLARVDKPAGFEVVLPSGRVFDAIADPAGTAERLARLARTYPFQWFNFFDFWKQ